MVNSYTKEGVESIQKSLENEKNEILKLEQSLAALNADPEGDMLFKDSQSFINSDIHSKVQLQRTEQIQKCEILVGISDLINKISQKSRKVNLNVDHLEVCELRNITVSEIDVENLTKVKETAHRISMKPLKIH